MIVAPSINSSFLINDDHQMMVKVLGTREMCCSAKELAIKWFNNNANYDDDLLLIFS